MNWQSLKNSLAEYPEAPLQFEYQPQRFVAPSYHITEIKQAQITSVDCGGKMNAWTEVVVQLWVPEGKAEGEPMSAGKAMKIIDLVEKSLSIHPEAPVKIEYGAADFATQQMPVEAISQDAGELRIVLLGDKTQCKAIDRGGVCGTETKPKIQLATIGASAESGACCTPESGCC